MEFLPPEDIEYLISGIEEGWLKADRKTLKLYYYYKEKENEICGNDKE